MTDWPWEHTYTSNLYHAWDAQQVHVPERERCWKCDERRAVEDSELGLCAPCRDEMRDVA